jgi:hypothetical protein
MDLPNRVRVAVYQHFVEHQRAPAIAELAAALDCGKEQVNAALEALAESHVLVLKPASREVWMAMPFSNVPTGFRVTSGDKAWWAN